MRHIHVAKVLLAVTAAACSHKAGTSASGPIALAPGEATASIHQRGDQVRVVGVDDKGALVDYGALAALPKLANNALGGVGAGKPIDAVALASAPLIVVAVDASRKASDVFPALGALDKKCTGFAVALGDTIGAIQTTPCPALEAPPPTSEAVALAVTVTAKDATLALSRVNEVQKVARKDLGAKLAEQKQSSFFAGDGCRDLAAAEQSSPPDPDATAQGTAMALDEGKMAMRDDGRCDVLLAFGDDATMRDVVETFQAAIKSGFTSPRWVARSALPPIEAQKPSAPDPIKQKVDADPDVKAAKDARDAAKTKVMAAAKDPSTTAAQIKEASDAMRDAEKAYRETRKRVKAALTGQAPPAP